MTPAHGTTPPRPLDSARELTVLAWRRTILRWVLVAVVSARIFSDELGPAVIIVALATIAGGVLLNFAASRAFSGVRTGSGLPSPGVPQLLRSPTVRLGLAAGGTLVLGLAALVWVLTT